MLKTKIQILSELNARIKGLVTTIPLARERPRAATQIPQLDAVLSGGVPCGALTEILSDEGHGAYAFALRIAAPLMGSSPWAVVDPEGTFYPPAVAQAGLDPAALILIRPAPQSAAWAFTQLLRCPALGASFLQTASGDNMMFRRFQLAAERGGRPAFVLRPLSAARRPCWAGVRLRVERTQDSGALKISRLHATTEDPAAPRECRVTPNPEP